MKEFSKKNISQFICLVYGITCILIVVLFFGSVEVDPVGTMFHGAFMSSRERAMTSAIQSFSAGIFPDLTSSHDHSIGFFLIGGLAGAKLGISNGYKIMVFLQLAYLFVCFIVLPFEIYQIRKKVCDFLLSFPLILIIYGELFFIYKTDVHWASIWCMTISFPVLIILKNERNIKKQVLLVSLISLYVSLANVIRAHSGLYVLIGMIYVVCLKAFTQKFFSIKQRSILLFSSLIIAICTYNLLGNTIPNWICVRQGLYSSNALSSFWHNFYIGFGVYKNPYGLYYSDDCARDIIMPKYPDIVYGGKEYFEICKALVIELIKSDPVFCIITLIKKFLESCVIVMKYYFGELKIRCLFNWGISAAFMFLLFTKKIKTEWGIWGIVLIYMFAGTMQAVMASPSYVFLLWPVFGGTGIAISYMGLKVSEKFIETLNIRKDTGRDTHYLR